jgi:hypothetical protein
MTLQIKSAMTRELIPEEAALMEHEHHLDCQLREFHPIHF